MGFKLLWDKSLGSSIQCMVGSHGCCILWNIQFSLLDLDPCGKLFSAPQTGKSK